MKKFTLLLLSLTFCGVSFSIHELSAVDSDYDLLGMGESWQPVNQSSSSKRATQENNHSTNQPDWMNYDSNFSTNIMDLYSKDSSSSAKGSSTGKNSSSLYEELGDIDFGKSSSSGSPSKQDSKKTTWKDDLKGAAAEVGGVFKDALKDLGKELGKQLKDEAKKALKDEIGNIALKLGKNIDEEAVNEILKEKEKNPEKSLTEIVSQVTAKRLTKKLVADPLSALSEKIGGDSKKQPASSEKEKTEEPATPLLLQPVVETDESSSYMTLQPRTKKGSSQSSQVDQSSNNVNPTTIQSGNKKPSYQARPVAPKSTSGAKITNPRAALMQLLKSGKNLSEADKLAIAFSEIQEQSINSEQALVRLASFFNEYQDKLIADNDSYSKDIKDFLDQQTSSIIQAAYRAIKVSIPNHIITFAQENDIKEKNGIIASLNEVRETSGFSARVDLLCNTVIPLLKTEHVTADQSNALEAVLMLCISEYNKGFPAGMEDTEKKAVVEDRLAMLKNNLVPALESVKTSNKSLTSIIKHVVELVKTMNINSIIDPIELAPAADESQMERVTLRDYMIYMYTYISVKILNRYIDEDALALDYPLNEQETKNAVLAVALGARDGGEREWITGELAFIASRNVGYKQANSYVLLAVDMIKPYKKALKIPDSFFLVDYQASVKPFVDGRFDAIADTPLDSQESSELEDEEFFYGIEEESGELDPFELTKELGEVKA